MKFMDRLLAGEFKDQNLEHLFEDEVEIWSKLMPALIDTSKRQFLHDWLGMTREEYFAYVEQRKTLNQIAEERNGK